MIEKKYQIKSAKKYVTSLIIMVLLPLTSCVAQQKELSQIESKYIIDLDGKQVTSIPISNYFKNAKTIILETKEDCLIGHIDELQVFDGCIFILDRLIAKSMYVFNSNGSFIGKIGSLGNGPGEYIQLIDFTLDTKNRLIYLLDYGLRIHIYHFDGSFDKTITPLVQKSNIMRIQYNNNRLYMCVLAHNPTPDDFMLLVADTENGKILSRFLPYKYNKGWTESISMGHGFFVSRLNNSPLFSQMFMDYIVSIGESITPYIKLTSKNLVTENDIKNITEVRGDRGDTPAMLGRYREYFRGKSLIYGVSSYVENEDFILFMYRQELMNGNMVVLHKKTNSIELGKIYMDLIFRNGDNRFFGGFAFSDTKGVYDVLNTMFIEQFKESIRNNEIVSELDKVNELLELEDDANPVIFYYEFK